MTPEVRVCRYCDEPITDPGDAVLVAQEAGNSGPGWNVWAHRAHAGQLGMHPVAVRALARILLARVFPQGG
ncbi:hypothetical protein ACFWR9_11675 [Streptomyces sp. NPDC058534]|uniref:hypothetical protein n=1 Tax=Streptomyces sp. NPDC058534 TaxID=3346541 RepID=UPI0036464CD6